MPHLRANSTLTFINQWQSVKKLGATVVLVGDAYDKAQAYAKKRAIEEGRTFIPPFDHLDVIMGQGTVGMEVMRQMKGPLKAIFVPVWCGGLIAGIAAYVKRVAPEVKIIVVEPSDANAMALSLHHGQRVILDKVGSFADGVAVKEDMFEEKRSILEPAGALELKHTSSIMATRSCACNCYARGAGSFKRFCELVGPLNITEFKYRCNSDKEAIVLYSVGVHMFLNLKNFKSGWNLLDLRLPILQKVTWLKITYDICKLFSSGIICELSARNFADCAVCCIIEAIHPQRKLINLNITPCPAVLCLVLIIHAKPKKGGFH
ncbi:hypothetical protein CMV_011032 [Castanea mollissima]|uniref:threonine ammonia-lyase n=1 Tax=Castanea mollissima TaxID=60419 RepID=A0A8J4VP61_9ROSI|nr:hypothetical protein CMV_011032 [Castanea mollissima]